MAKQKPVRRPLPTRPSSIASAEEGQPETRKISSRQPTERKSEAKSSFFSFRGEPLLYQRKHFQIMLIGVGLIALGLALMSGGQQPNPNTWDPKIIYSHRIITVAPILILMGLGLQIYAIFLPGKIDATTEEATQ